MNTWAIIKTGGKQYKVWEGQTLAVERIIGEAGTKLDFGEVMLVSHDSKIVLGTPYIDKASVGAKLVEEFKDKKIRVVKFKPKSRYLRTRGHRAKKTKILIEKINFKAPQTASK